MTRIYNQQIFKEKRRELRHAETPAEKLLWAKIRGKQLRGLRFMRQYSAGAYILDFYCPKARLAIELDGQQHKVAEIRDYDIERGRYLESLKIRTIRFWNAEVVSAPEGVLTKIVSALPLELKRESEGV